MRPAILAVDRSVLTCVISYVKTVDLSRPLCSRLPLGAVDLNQINLVDLWVTVRGAVCDVLSCVRRAPLPPFTASLVIHRT